ncbi:2-oxoglutarate (2OG) and Fe(II)-dependent oxygenase superfamily protein [Euphorbia peplus]|nr:2-oxoglutarate (2OG) and Fe(II)-dependent oxygenase superfamily protein [Euphorbia peplus]
MGIEHPTNEQPFMDFTHLMWPHGNQHFCETIHSYAKLMDEVHEVLVRMLCASYDVGKEYTESRIEWTYLMLLLKYRRSAKDSNMVLRGHMDKNFFSILHQNHVKALEISSKHGDDDHSKNGDDDHQWIPYLPSSHCSFIVIAGDACMGWSNDRIKSCYHRVVVEDEQIRYSIGLASFLKGLIKTPTELVDEEHPLKYKPFENESLLHFYNSSNDPNRNDINMVKALCGI